MSMTRQERKENITKQRKQQIFDASLKVFSKRGFDQATIPDIAEEAGVAVGTIYNYYQNKHDLLLSIIKSYIDTESLRSLLKQPAQLDAPSFISFLLNERLSIGFDNSDALQLLMSEIRRDPELRRQYVEQVVVPTINLLEKYMESSITSDTVRSLNIHVIVRALVGLIIGLSIISSIEGEQGLLRSIPRHELAAEITKLILEGIRKK
jgi:TetR/AcrR family fatty acid metabolism transcriptional regulator